MEIVGCQGHSPAFDDQAAVEHLTRCLAAELAVDGIRVNAVVPGPAATSILATLGDDINIKLLGLSVSCAWLLLYITSTFGFSSVIGDEVAQAFGIALQPVRDQPMDCSFRVLPVGATLARWASSEDLDALVDGACGPDMKLSGPDSIDHLLIEHQVRYVRRWDDDALFPG